ncbi:GldG family protein [candidate division NPL-UPA2 bacterium]|nr:GldG family protein [candidate division NPL-UPA2 bacterium]
MAVVSRKAKFGANVFIQSLLFLALWAMANYVSSRRYHRFDVTFSRQFTLSDKTKKVLRDLDKPLRITTLYRPGDLFFQVKDLLEEYSAASRKITVEHIDAERDPARAQLKVQQLAERLNIDTFELNTVIFESGGRSKHVPQSEIIEYDFSGHPYAPREPKFKGEEAFTSAILSVTEEEQISLYFVTGHGEKDIENFRPDGLSELSKLFRRRNMNVEKLSLLKEGKIPDDCDVLIIPGPTKKFSSDEKDIINAYLEGGGRCLIMIDPLSETGLEALLRQWGVDIGDDIVLDPVNRLPFVGATTLLVSSYPYHAITEGMKGVATVFPLVRSVDPVSKDNLNAVSLVRTSDEAWGEIKVRAREARFDEGEDKKGPISIAVAVSERAEGPPYGPPVPAKKGTRLVVFGDSDFISNAQIANPGNADLVLNSVNWLAERERLISISPRSPDIRRVILSHKAMVAIFWLAVAGIPFLALLAGGVVWWRRRV